MLVIGRLFSSTAICFSSRYMATKTQFFVLTNLFKKDVLVILIKLSIKDSITNEIRVQKNSHFYETVTGRQGRRL